MARPMRTSETLLPCKEETTSLDIPKNWAILKVKEVTLKFTFKVCPAGRLALRIDVDRMFSSLPKGAKVKGDAAIALDREV